MVEIPGVNNLEAQFDAAFGELGLNADIKNSARTLLLPFKELDPIHREHYDHCVRVGLLARRIAQFRGFDEKALFLAGIFHDVGKQEIRSELLGKTDPWTDEDKNEVQGHVLAGYRLLRGKFDFSAEIMLLHHRFQSNAYPKELPTPSQEFSEETSELINEYAKTLVIADVYDALHRDNSRFGEKHRLTDTEIEVEMKRFDPEHRELIE